MKLLFKHEIKGCEQRGDGESTYMTRYGLPRMGPLRICLHIFHRSDADELHDHPWPFVSIILWRGYNEITFIPSKELTTGVVTNTGRKYSRKWPGMILFRKAEHTHRVELIDGKKAITLVIFGKRVREWGFYTKRGWQWFSDYFRERGC
jgi:hypothetical protein